MKLPVNFNTFLISAEEKNELFSSIQFTYSKLNRIKWKSFEIIPHKAITADGTERNTQKSVFASNANNAKQNYFQRFAHSGQKPISISI